MSDNLKKETVFGAGWSLVENIIKLGISFIVSIVMARLLNPSIYGIVGVVTIFTSLCSSFVDCGLSTALIRKKNANELDFSTIFIANFSIALFLYFILYVSSPFIASFFSIDDLTKVLRVSGLCILIDSISLIQKTILTKRIDFKTQTKVTAIAGVISGAVGIIMAFAGFGIWALVAHILATSTLISVQLWIYNRWFPKMVFSWSSFKEMFGFGWKLMIIGLLSTLWQNAYNFVIGKFYSPASLGLYSRAKQFSDIFSTNITNVVQRVSMPVLSKIQDEKERMMAVYIRSIRLTAYVTFILLLGLSGISNSLVYVLLGEKWIECASYIPLVAANVLLFPIGMINLNMIALKGRSDYCLYVELIKKAIAIVPIVLGVIYNIKIMLISSVIVSTFSYGLNCYYSKKVIDYGFISQIKDVFPSFALSMFMFSVLKAIEMINISAYILLPIQIISGAIIVLLISSIFNLYEFNEVKSIISILCSKFSKKTNV